MNQMMAAQLRGYGGPDVLTVESVPRPAVGVNEVLVRVEASTVNQHDAAVRSGTLKVVTGRKFPLGVGLDFSGTVVEVGPAVDDVAPGTRVWGMVSPKTGNLTGSAAQYASVPANRVAPMPATLSWTDASSLVTSGTDVIRAMRDIAHLQHGEQILIRGAAGSVGITAVQLAVAMGAHVTALAGAGDLAFVRELGAHEALDYREVRARELPKFDVVFDTTGTDLLAYRRRLRPGGRMVTIAFGSVGAMLSIGLSSVFASRRVRTFSGYPDRALLDDLAVHVASGAIWPVVDTVYPLSAIADAHRALEGSRQRGKLVLTTAGP